MKRILALVMGLMLIVAAPFSAEADFKKTKIAVLDFELQGEGYETEDMGTIVAEWFITALVKEGRFDVVERAMLSKIMNEQKMGISGIVDESSATQLGKILGVKIIISGSVMKLQDVLEVNARIIDVETASIIAAENVKSTASTSLQSLIVRMSDKIIKNFPLEGYIVARNDDSVSIDLGKRTGIKPDMEFMVFKEGSVVKHPKTGEVLDVELIQSGKLKIIGVSQKIARATIIEEEEDVAIAVGQMVKSISGPLTPIKEEVYVPPSAGYRPPPRNAPLKSADYIAKLQSSNLKDKVWGAKKIIKDGVKDPAVLDVLEKLLLEIYNEKPRDRNHSDAVAWMVKALGASVLPQYKDTIQKIAKDAKNRKVRGYAIKTLRTY
ncbi:MAG: FlgO family outer membrane protein [Desulfurivibrionaceae bacterium]|nr:FlgO family outer membrane protein [Desulfobulbales bacterium]MDT8335668.1 FlgO family outer membrane protein [Desulfurivibrionaceae bacterium]